MPKQVRSANSPRPGSYSKIEPPSASESSTAWATIVVRTSAASRLELTAWLISPRARSSSTERASSAPRSWSSRKRWTFEIAIAPWAANVVTSSIVSLAERVDLGAAEHDDPDDPPVGEHRDAEQRAEAAEVERCLPLVARIGPRVLDLEGAPLEADEPDERARSARDRVAWRSWWYASERRPSRSRGDRRGRRAARPARVRVAEPDGVAEHRLEHRLEVERRLPDRLEDVARRALVLDGAREVPLESGDARVRFGRAWLSRTDGLHVAPASRGRTALRAYTGRQAFIKSPSAQRAVSGSSLVRSWRSWSRSARRFARRTCASRSRRCSSAVSVRSGGTSPTGRPCSSTATIVM